MPTILFTRSIDDAYKHQLTIAGFKILEHNVLTIKALPHATSQILNALKDFKNLVFTSQHAVRIFFEVLNNYHTPLDPSVKIFSTSGETKNLLQKFGYSPVLSAHAAEPLARLMLEKIDFTNAANGGQKEAVHFICGTLSLPVLPTILLENGVILKKIRVYETVKHPLSIEPSATPLDAAVFFSLSAADAFLMKNQLNDKTLIFTLGSTTAQYIKEKTGTNRIFVAEKPTIGALIQTILKEFSNFKNI